MLMRHGSRYPGEKLIKFMQNVLPNLRDNILNYYKKNKGKQNLIIFTFFQYVLVL